MMRSAVLSILSVSILALGAAPAAHAGKLVRPVARNARAELGKSLAHLERHGAAKAKMSMAGILEETPQGSRVLDPYTRLLKDRVMFLGPVTDESANAIVAQMLALDAMNSEDPMHLYINSPGGSISAGMAIYDTMKFVKAEVHTIGIGMAASMGSFLLAAGEPGHRYALPNTRIMIHQPRIEGGIGGTTADIAIHAQEMINIREHMAQLYADNSAGKMTKDQVLAAIDRDRWLNPEGAKELGLIDHVMHTRDQLNAKK